MRELHAVAPALAKLGGALALVDDAGLFEKAAVAHFHEDAIALHDLIKAPERGLKRLIVFDYDTSHEITFLSIDLVELGTLLIIRDAAGWRRRGEEEMRR